MTKKKANIDTNTDELPEETIAAVSKLASSMAAPDKRNVTVQQPKKRIRIRKKATKKLSVAVLCANPSMRRFN